MTTQICMNCYACSAVLLLSAKRGLEFVWLNLYQRLLGCWLNFPFFPVLLLTLSLKRNSIHV